MSRGALLVALAVAALVLGAGIGIARGRGAAPPAPPTPATPAPATPPAEAATSASSPVITVTDAKQFEKLLADHHGPVLLDFHAEWCKPCKELEPRVAELARKRPELLVASIDVVAAEALGNTYGAESLPLLVRLQDGKEVARQVGAPTLAQLEAWLDQPMK